MKNGEFAIRVERRFRGHQFENVDPIKRPAVTLCDETKLLLGLGQGDVEDSLSLTNALKQKLQRDRRLAGPGPSLIEIKPVPIEPAAKDVIQADATGRNPCR